MKVVLSFDTAKKLRDAGLQWEPQVGDWCYFNNDENTLCLIVSVRGYYVINAVTLEGEQIRGHLADFTPDPRLDQLLDEIERRRYWGVIGFGLNPRINIGPVDGAAIGREFKAETLDEAAAAALLWVLEKEKEANPNDAKM